MALNEEFDRPEAANPLASRDHLAAGMKAIFALADHWHLTAAQIRILLGRPSERTFYNWKSGKTGNPSHDTMCRIGYLLGIHRALRTIFSSPENVYGWISRENADFNGQSPLERMLGGDLTDLAYVRQYLDALRGGWA
ncbi:MAG: MbcA/ParS/Xre antitoxin family protein [Alphaproteobacteria bacterium]|nr:MbcA/ParS/Xre antitoxin family protein [Alphaproteobacteria bacterium]